MKPFGQANIGLIITTLFFASAFYFLFGLLGAALGFIFSLGVIAYAFSLSDQKIIEELSLRKIIGQSAYDLNEIVACIAQKAKVPVPQVFTSQQPYAQAFTFGRSLKRPKLVIFHELLENLNSREIETLVCLLIAQIKLKKQFSHSISSIFIQFILNFTHFIDVVLRFLSGIKYSQHNRSAQPFTFLLSPLVSFYISFFQKSSDIYRADQMAADWLDNKQRVTRLLNKIHSYSLSSKSLPPLKYGHIFLTSPLTSLKWGRYLTWQPNIKLRTSRLVGHYPA